MTQSHLAKWRIVALFALLTAALLACSPTALLGGRSRAATSTPVAALPVTPTITRATATVAPAATDTPAPTKEPTPTEERRQASDIHLEADGSGDYATLAEAIRAVEEGGTITLGAGTYELAKPLSLRRPVRLVGAGLGETEVVSDGEGYVLRLQGDGPYEIEGISFRHDGSDPAEVVLVRGAEVAFRDCAFIGGVSGENEAGSGLLLEGKASGSVQDSQAFENEGDGFGLVGRANLEMTGNECSNNGASGIGFYDEASGTASGNTCEGNDYHGVYLEGQAQAELLANNCSGNGDSGIAYFGESGGLARDNDCSRNAAHGIAVVEQAAPTLEGNTLSDNDDSGLVYFQGAGGSASDNICDGNANYGIYVDDASAPDLGENACEVELAAEPTPEPAAGGPRFNPGGPETCLDVPEQALEKDWQTSAPREGLQAGESAEIGLRNKYGESGEEYDLIVTVYAPDETRALAEAHMAADEWAMVYYPDDFALDDGSAAPSPGRGIYTVTWEVADTGFVACDGFVVVGDASSMRGSIEGKDLLFDAEDGEDWEVFAIGVDGTGLANVTNDDVNNSSADVSPDGIDLVLSGEDGDGNWDIYVMGVDGVGYERITNAPAYDAFPLWSPDGGSILFSSDRDGDWEVYVMAADGSGQANLTQNRAQDFDPDWSPDGSRIVFSSHRDGNSEIYVMDADGGNVQRLTDHAKVDSFPNWSPDGSRIVFSSDREGSYDLYIMDADGSNVQQITSGEGSDEDAVWSPYHDLLAFVSDQEGSYDIWVVSPDGSGLRRLTEEPGAENVPRWIR